MQNIQKKSLINSTHSEKTYKGFIHLPTVAAPFYSQLKNRRNLNPLTAAEKDIRNQVNELKEIISKKVGKGIPNFSEMKFINPEGLDNLKKVQKPGYTFKKTRFKKTKFKIPRNMQNVEKLQEVICGFVNKHKSLKNDVDCANMKEYDKKSPFMYGTFDFVDEILKDNNLIKERFGYNEKNLSKNRLLLEKVLLTRLAKREDNLKKMKQL